MSNTLAGFGWKDGKFYDSEDWGEIGGTTPEVLATVGKYIIGSPYRIGVGMGGSIEFEYGVWIVDVKFAQMIAEFPTDKAAMEYAIWRNAIEQTKENRGLDLEKLATAMGGKLDSVSGQLPDGSGCATMSFPLPKDHWLTRDDRSEEPPMPFRRGVDEPDREEWVEKLREAARWAIKASTDNGKLGGGGDNDYDPDAMVTNFVIACVGFWTEDGRGSS